MLERKRTHLQYSKNNVNSRSGIVVQNDKLAQNLLQQKMSFFVSSCLALWTIRTRETASVHVTAENGGVIQLTHSKSLQWTEN
jgi:hypothetical protein